MLRPHPMVTIKRVAAALLGLGLAVPPAVPGVELSDADARFEELDRNWDGFLSRDEVAKAAQVAARFDKFDINRDGRLDRDEFRTLLVSLNSARPASP